MLWQIYQSAGKKLSGSTKSKVLPYGGTLCENGLYQPQLRVFFQRGKVLAGGNAFDLFEHAGKIELVKKPTETAISAMESPVFFSREHASLMR